MIATLSISLMLGVQDAPAAAQWYTTALGARELWNLGSVIGLEIRGAPFFLHEASGEGLTIPLVRPSVIGQTTVRVEVLVDDPDDFIDRAVAAGATDSGDGVRERRVPWGSIDKADSSIRSGTCGWSLIGRRSRRIRPRRGSGRVASPTTASR